ncbi:MAG TPA: hypothetical protein VIH22_19625 [Cyclobacteriaceae bacterium]
MKRIIIVSLVASLCAVVYSTLINQENFYHPEFSKPRPSFGIEAAHAYPPAVGILSSSKNCMSCHVDNGPWNEDNLIVDILDMDTKKSLKQSDGSFVIETERWEQKKLITVVGWIREKSVPAPYRNAWLYLDPSTVGTLSLSKFAPDWDVNLPLSCRVVGDKLPGYENADITSLPMIIQPMSNAKNAELQLQIMLTKGESIKGNAQEGMLGNYFERKVFLKIK